MIIKVFCKSKEDRKNLYYDTLSSVEEERLYQLISAKPLNDVVFKDKDNAIFHVCLIADNEVNMERYRGIKAELSEDEFRDMFVVEHCTKLERKTKNEKTFRFCD